MQKTPKKNVTMGIGFNLRLISKLVLVTILNYKIVPMKKFIFFDRCNLVCLSCYIIHVIVHIAHFGILYLLQYEKLDFFNVPFFLSITQHGLFLFYTYFILVTI